MKMELLYATYVITEKNLKISSFVLTCLKIFRKIKINKDEKGIKF